jgi:hypothetical protein
MSNQPERLLQDANHSMVYTDEVIICDSCGERYESGFLTEIRGKGLYCMFCLKPAFEEYFSEHPNEDYVLTRGISSLAYRKGHHPKRCRND